MKHNLLIIILVAVIIFLGLPFQTVYGHSATLQQQPASGCYPYIVRSGDTLSAIASRCGVSTTRLAQANNLTLNSTIYPGQKLVMPGAAPAPQNKAPGGAAPAGGGGCTSPYIVKSGDTLSLIAGRCGTTVRALMNLNGLSSANLIRVGQSLKTRGAPPAPPASSVGPAITPAPAATPPPAPPSGAAPTATPSIESPIPAW